MLKGKGIMQRTMLLSKIYGGRLTGTELYYEGSMAIDEELMEAAGFLPGEMIHVLNITNAQRLVTYAITAPAGSGTLELRGAAARLGQVNDEIIILSYCQMDNEEAKNHTPTVVRVTEGNKLKKLQ